MAESVHEQIAAALQTSLEAIEADGGTTYHYTPAAVVRVLWYDDRLLDTSIDGPIYAIRPGDEVISEDASSSMAMGHMEVFILVAQKFEEPETPHAPAAIPKWKVVNRMVRDVVRMLLTDVQLATVPGSAVENVMKDGVVVDRDQAVDGWAVAELRFTVEYRFTGPTP